jgi:D-3-phosphoglycerate dehydrogenase
MNMLIITDQFVSKDVVKKIMPQYVRDFGKMNLTFIENDWPLTPLLNNDEIKEFLGDEDEISRKAADADIIFTHTGPVSRKILDAAGSVKLIAVPRGGPVNINIDYAAERSIPVVNAPGRNGPVVAEYTIGLILSAVHNIAQAHADMRNKTWRGDFYVYENSGFELEGRTAGLIGYGAIGSRVANILRTFGMHVMVYDPFITEDAVKESGAQLVSLDTLLSSSDIISLHARLSAETQHMIAAEEFSKMKPGAYFINSARGGLVDYPALINALKSGSLGGAALDVYYEEPLPLDSELYNLPNVILTPHIAGSSKETAERAVRIAAEDIQRFLDGQLLKHSINGIQVKQQP